MGVETNGPKEEVKSAGQVPPSDTKPQSSNGPRAVETMPPVIITAKRPRHPVEGPSVEVDGDGKIGVNTPCPIEKVGPVNLVCGAGVNIPELQLYGRVRGTMPVPGGVLPGFRLMAEFSGSLGVGGKENNASLGLASPSLEVLGGLSVTLSVKPKGKVSVGLVSDF